MNGSAEAECIMASVTSSPFLHYIMHLMAPHLLRLSAMTEDDVQMLLKSEKHTAADNDQLIFVLQSSPRLYSVTSALADKVAHDLSMHVSFTRSLCCRFLDKGKQTKHMCRQ